MTWFHLILGIYIILTVGPLLTTLCIDTPKIPSDPEPGTSPAPRLVQPHNDTSPS